MLQRKAFTKKDARLAQRMLPGSAGRGPGKPRKAKRNNPAAGLPARPPELLYSVYSVIASTAICGLPGSFTVTRPEAPVCTRVRVISQVSITSMA